MIKSNDAEIQKVLSNVQESAKPEDIKTKVEAAIGAKVVVREKDGDTVVQRVLNG